MSNEYKLFINKYTPIYFKDFCIDATVIELLQNLIKSDHLNILFVGNTASGKSTLLNIIIKE